MRILCFTDSVPSASTGGSLRRYNLLKGLAERHQMRILVFTAQTDDLTPYGLDEAGAEVRFVSYKSPPRTLPNRLIGNAIVLLAIPISSVFCDRRLGRQMAEEVRDFPADVILVMGNDLALNIPHWVSEPIVADLCDAQSLRVGLSKGWWKRLACKAWSAWMEKMLSRRCDKCVFVSQRDATASNCALRRTDVAPNGVDTAYFHPPENEPSPHHVVFVGVMSYPPNVDAVMHLWEDIWPLIRTRTPDAQCDIVGMDPPDSIKCLDGKDGFHVTGYVDDVRPYCWNSAIAVLPIRFASGQQNKALQAMAMGMPVVTYPKVQEGIGAAQEDGMLTVTGPEEFARELFRLMSDDDYRKRLSIAATQFVQVHCSWDTAVSKLDDILESVRR